MSSALSTAHDVSTTINPRLAATYLKPSAICSRKLVADGVGGSGFDLTCGRGRIRISLRAARKNDRPLARNSVTGPPTAYRIPPRPFAPSEVTCLALDRSA